ncbi:MAG: heavy-metal-associated domain-containing protein [Saprospiraceae bacterium]|nr:heavy-metal-associated domain-containing protein [Saprospiraceae bacterium]
MRTAFLLSLVFLGFLSFAQAQVKYTIQIERPTGVKDSEIVDLFGEYPDIRGVQLSGDRLELTVPDREDYPIRTIRDILAQKKIAALDVEMGPGQSTGARKKSLKLPPSPSMDIAMCKDRIERATRSVKGVVMANWNAETLQLTLKYLPERTTLTEIKKAIAAVGHDTDEVRASDEVYQNLHTCCQYDRPAPKKEK